MLRRFPDRDVTAFGNILIEFLIPVTDTSWQRLALCGIKYCVIVGQFWGEDLKIGGV